MNLPKRALTSEQKRIVVERILVAWESWPELRLGQLLFNALASMVHDDASDGPSNENMLLQLFNIEDMELSSIVSIWVTAATYRNP